MKFNEKTLTPVQVGQVVKALVLLGADEVTVKQIEKDRFVVTTTERNGPTSKKSSSV